MTLEKTHPTFQVKIAKLADVTGETINDLFAKWETYTENCRGWDQSPLLWEFVQGLNGDTAQMREAVR